MGDKRVLTLLLGSPRAGGNTEALADALARGAREKGMEIRKTRLAAMNLEGCRDCRMCWSSNGPCVQKDDMDKVYADIEAADVVTFVSPLYFYSWSMQIKPVWDRFLPYGSDKAERSLRGKKGVLLSAAGDDNPACFEGIAFSFRRSSEWLGWDIAGEVLAYDIYGKGEMTVKGAGYLKQAEELGRRL